MKILGQAAVVAAFFVAASPAVAAHCAPREAALAVLVEDYGEQPIGGGIASQGPMLEVLVNERSGSWTVIVTTPDGRSCIVSHGEGWRSYEPAPVGEGA